VSAPAAAVTDGQALVAVDLGAESCRVSLLRWTPDGPRIELVHRFANAPERRADGLRWNLDCIARGVDDGLAQCAAIAKEGIASIAVDGWAVDSVRLGADGVVSGDPFCYRDERFAAAQQSLHQRISAPRLRELTGIQIQPLNTIYQLYADRLAGEPQTRLQMRWLNLPEYMLYRWGSEAVAERTNATHTGLVGLDGNWNEEIFAAAGLDRGLAPRLVGPGTLVGEYRGTVKALHGARLIAPCCHDTASAVAGIAATGADWAYISSGTWSLIGAVLDAPCNTAEAAAENFTNLGAVGGQTLFHKGIAGMWLLRQCMTAWQTDDVAGLVEAASRIAPFAPEELIDVEDPSLSLPGVMPDRINAQRTLRGLKPVEEKAAMAWLIFDSLAARYAAVLGSVERITGKQLRRVHIVGGGSRNELLNRLTAEATGLEVVRGAVESSTLGNFAVQLASAEGDLSAGSVAQWAARLAASMQPGVSA
jgi:rhamnulokinase